MSKSFYIKLIFAVYKVTELFPAGQTLKKEIRKTADEILVGLLTNQHENISQNLTEMEKLLNLAEKRQWGSIRIDPRNFLVLRREYAKIAKFIVGRLPNISGGTPPAIEDEGVNSGKTVENSFNDSKNKKRQKVILNILKNNSKVKVSDLARTFPDINRRTLIRDLGSFCQIGLVERNGNGRGVCYTIRNATL